MLKTKALLLTAGTPFIPKQMCIFLLKIKKIRGDVTDILAKTKPDAQTPEYPCQVHIDAMVTTECGCSTINRIAVHLDLRTSVTG